MAVAGEAIAAVPSGGLQISLRSCWICPWEVLPIGGRGVRRRIVSASVHFTADEVGSGAVALTLRGEAADHAAPFAATAFNGSGRSVTSSSLAWSPPAWTAIGAAGAAQRTPDLSALVQEIVDRPGWAPGNPLVLVVTGTGKRTAESFEGAPAAAPVLRVEYRVEALGPP